MIIYTFAGVHALSLVTVLMIQTILDVVNEIMSQTVSCGTVSVIIVLAVKYFFLATLCLENSKLLFIGSHFGFISRYK